MRGLKTLDPNAVRSVPHQFLACEEAMQLTRLVLDAPLRSRINLVPRP